jgi:hypothetical protein
LLHAIIEIKGIVNVRQVLVPRVQVRIHVSVGHNTFISELVYEWDIVILAVAGASNICMTKEIELIPSHKRDE